MNLLYRNYFRNTDFLNKLDKNVDKYVKLVFLNYWGDITVFILLITVSLL